MPDITRTTPQRFHATRRGFVSSAASAAFGLTLVPRHVLGGRGYVAPSEQLQVAGIGGGGMGAVTSPRSASWVLTSSRCVMWTTNERLARLTLIIDHPVWALRLGAPTSVESSVSHDGTRGANNEVNMESFPKAAMVTYQFPERDGGKLPPVTMTWYDGGLMPPTPAEMSGDQRLPDNTEYRKGWSL